MVCQLSPPSECNDKISPQAKDTHMHDFAGVWSLRGWWGEWRCREPRQEREQPNTLVHHLVRISYGPSYNIALSAPSFSLSLALALPASFHFALPCPALPISWNSMLEHKWVPPRLGAGQRLPGHWSRLVALFTFVFMSNGRSSTALKWRRRWRSNSGSGSGSGCGC